MLVLPQEHVVSRVPVASFARLPAGWGEYRDAPGVSAFSWHYTPNSSGWALSMPRGGIVVNVWFPHPRGSQRYRPLRVVFPHRAARLLEGTRDTPEYRIYGRVGGYDVNIFIDIRRLHPTQAELCAARLAVSNIRFS